MLKIFQKPNNLYHQPMKQKGFSFNSEEPSDQTTLGKIFQKPQNKIQNDQPITIIPNNNEDEIKREVSHFTIVNSKEEERKTKEKNKKNEKYYLSREIALTVEAYGRELFSCLKDNEPQFLIPIDFMKRHRLSPQMRERMVDWMVEVFNEYKCDPGIFELAVHIMDCYISRTKKRLRDEDIHLIGLTCIYISSKVEDCIPLRMPHIVKDIGHYNFDEETIMKEEREIIKTIDFDLFTASTYDYIMIFFYDLKVNNIQKINNLEGSQIIEKFLNFSIFLSQLLLYNSEFVCYRQSLNALGVLALAFDILKTNLKDINSDLKNFLSDWVYYLINELGFKSDAISFIYTKIYNFYYLKVLMPQEVKAEKKKKKGHGSNIINLCKYNQDKFI